MSIIKTNKLQTVSGQTMNNILQVQYGFDSGTSTSNSGWTATSLQASITPFFATSKILIMVSMTCRSSGNRMGWRLVRTVGGTGTVVYGQLEGLGVFNAPQQQTFQYIDSPATSSVITYQVQIYNPNTGATIQTNDSGSNVGLNANNLITLWEVAQ